MGFTAGRQGATFFIKKKTGMKKIFPRILTPKNLFTLAALILLIINLITLGLKHKKMRQARQQIPYIFMGYKFSGLKEILKNTDTVGYVTDKNMDDRNSALQFAQAQFILAPVILELNRTDTRYLLIDCTNPQIAREKIRKIGAVPLKMNQFGIILAKNPRPAIP